MKRKPEPVAGQVFNRLRADFFVGYRHGARHWRCTCICGNTTEVAVRNLWSSKVRSCGCLSLDRKRDARRFIDTGDCYGMLTVLAQEGVRGGERLWRCRCACGNISMVTTSALRSGNTKSCGCLSRESRKVRATTHGMRHSPEYNSWLSMKARVLNPNNIGFKYYGGRGIKISERWLDSFENFYADMGPRPPGTNLDRANNEGDYKPGNARWSSYKEQANNRRARGEAAARGIGMSEQ